MSFGGDVFGPEGDLVVKTAIDNAYEQGVLLVASAGNSDSSLRALSGGLPQRHGGRLAPTARTPRPATARSGPGWTSPPPARTSSRPISAASTSPRRALRSPRPTWRPSRRWCSPIGPNLTHVQVRAILENTTRSRLLRRPGSEPGLHRHRAGQCLRGSGGGRRAAIRWARSSRPDAAGLPGRRQCHRAEPVRARRFLRARLPSLSARPTGRAIAAGAARNGSERPGVAVPGQSGRGHLRAASARASGAIASHTDRTALQHHRPPEQAHWPKPQDDEDEESYWTYFLGSPLCLDVNGDGRNEIIQAAPGSTAILLRRRNGEHLDRGRQLAAELARVDGLRLAVERRRGRHRRRRRL